MNPLDGPTIPVQFVADTESIQDAHRWLDILGSLGETTLDSTVDDAMNIFAVVDNSMMDNVVKFRIGQMLMGDPE